VKIDPLVYSAKFPERCRPEVCRSRCCQYGVWADLGELHDILAHAELFRPYVRREATDTASWFGKEKSDRDCPSGTAARTTIVGNACAFFNPDHGCALQKGAVVAGHHEWRFKPRFCVMFPLVLSSGQLTVDEKMKSLWCMKDRNRTHPILHSVRKEVSHLFDEELVKILQDPGRSCPRRA